MKTKMGRPRLPKGDVRDVLMTTRVNTHEEKAILAAVKASGLDKTAWLRKALLAVANVSNGTH